VTGVQTCALPISRADPTADVEAQKAELFEQIGRLKMELEWLKKKVGPVA